MRGAPMRPEEQLVTPADVTPACELGSNVHLALIGVRNLHDHPNFAVNKVRAIRGAPRKVDNLNTGPNACRT